MATSGEGPGEPTSSKNRALNLGASVSQSFAPLSNICAHLHAYHIYASEPTRCVEANHYCSQINEDMRQCLIYDSPEKNARLIGVEYMVTPRIYETLPEDERKLWHSHEYEVKSGILIMPCTSKITPAAVWDKAETTEMEQVLPLYGKTYHMWQIDRGDKVPLGAPQLMASFTSDEDVKKAEPKGPQGLWERTKARFGVDPQAKAELRKDVCPGHKVHPDADSMTRE